MFVLQCQMMTTLRSSANYMALVENPFKFYIQKGQCSHIQLILRYHYCQVTINWTHGLNFSWFIWRCVCLVIRFWKYLCFSFQSLEQENEEEIQRELLSRLISPYVVRFTSKHKQWNRVNFCLSVYIQTRVWTKIRMVIHTSVWHLSAIYKTEFT